MLEAKFESLLRDRVFTLIKRSKKLKKTNPVLSEFLAKEVQILCQVHGSGEEFLWRKYEKTN